MSSSFLTFLNGPTFKYGQSDILLRFCVFALTTTHSLILLKQITCFAFLSHKSNSPSTAFVRMTWNEISLIIFYVLIEKINLQQKQRLCLTQRNDYWCMMGKSSVARHNVYLIESLNMFCWPVSSTQTVDSVLDKSKQKEYRFIFGSYVTHNSVHLKTENIFKFVVRVAKQSFSFVWFSGRLKRSWEIFTSIPLISSSWLRMANNPKKCRSWEKTHFLSTFPLHTALQVAGFYEIAFKWLLTTTQSTTQQVQKKTDWVP